MCIRCGNKVVAEDILEGSVVRKLDEHYRNKHNLAQEVIDRNQPKEYDVYEPESFTCSTCGKKFEVKTLADEIPANIAFEKHALEEHGIEIKIVDPVTQFEKELIDIFKKEQPQL